MQTADRQSGIVDSLEKQTQISSGRSLIKGDKKGQRLSATRADDGIDEQPQGVPPSGPVLRAGISTFSPGRAQLGSAIREAAERVVHGKLKAQRQRADSDKSFQAGDNVGRSVVDEEDVEAEEEAGVATQRSESQTARARQGLLAGGGEAEWDDADSRPPRDKARDYVEDRQRSLDGAQPHSLSASEELERALASLRRYGEMFTSQQVDMAFRTAERLEKSLLGTDHSG